MSKSSIIRDGFMSSYGRFYTYPGKMERIDGQALRCMFLPKLTKAANTFLQNHQDFVQGQLSHYGVEYSPGDLKGSGTLLLQKVLNQGKCDMVPDHIERLRSEMHMEWLNAQAPEDIVCCPRFIIEKYFLDASGNPDKTKTTSPVPITLPRYSHDRLSGLLEAAGEVDGLHYRIELSHDTQTIFLGMDLSAVEQAARDHVEKEAREREAKKRKREEDRASMHTKYIASIRRPQGGIKPLVSPLGSYIVDCEAIEEKWPDRSDDLTLDISESGEQGIYQAAFDFGVLKGVMMISTEMAALDRYRTTHDDDEDRDDEAPYDAEGESQDEEEYEEPVQTSYNAKRKAACLRAPPSKKAKTAKGGEEDEEEEESLTFQLQWRGQEKGDGEILSNAEEGEIEFADADFSSFTAKVNLSVVGSGVTFTARKVGGYAAKVDSWSYYSRAKYEHRRRN
ncbi:hypothetical protein F4778DRAFT_795041 [Xylariomycetidae sp. FL2044]|nr:hypothetical protein F4778DRAFT_795041 [Xylariomycetidae sp. FL2044]